MDCSRVEGLVTPHISARAALRAALRPDHDRVDAAFGRFDLARRNSYAAFLRAHARALFTVERAIGTAPVWPSWRPRADLLRADIAKLGETPPGAIDHPLPDSTAAAWGMTYVLEGSRLGGQVLRQRASPELPFAYLAAAHLPDEWRDFTASLDERFAGSDVEDYSEAEGAARQVFALFERAAEEEARRLSG
jgi:heme oxygenase